jgi:hypothetical protein
MSRGASWTNTRSGPGRNSVPLSALRRELEAQVERFPRAQRGPARSPGLPPLCPPLPALLPGLCRSGSPLSAARPRPFPPATDFPRQSRPSPSWRVSPRSGAGHDRHRQRPGPVPPPGPSRPLLSAPSFGRHAIGVDPLLRLLEALPEGLSELMCHPGYDDPALAPSSYRAEREMELATLTHPRVQARLQELGIELVNFSALSSC